jgi:hypothetical protein
VGWPLLATRAARGLQVATFASRGCTIDPQVANGPPVVVEPRAGLRCTLSLQVTNTGSVGGGVEELRVRPHDGPPDSGAVTVYRVHGRVGAGQTRTFTMALVDNPEGCKVAGTLELDPWPAVRVHVWGRTREVGSSTALALRNVPNEPRGDGCT